MDIVIVGSGNVAHCFGRRFKRAGHNILQVISRSREHARLLAQHLEAAWDTRLAGAEREADIYLLAVQDSAIAAINKEWRLEERLVAHTSGAVPLGAIRDISANTGVLYPLQSLRKELQGTVAFPVLLEADSETALKQLHLLAPAISDHIVEMDSARRLKIHLAAVLCNNFTNHLVARCKDYCEKESLDFNLLKPLLGQTFDRLQKYAPQEVQTGPAMRNDEVTMELHRQQLAAYPDLLAIYELLSEDIRRLWSPAKRRPEAEY